MNASIFVRDMQWVWAGLLILVCFAICAGCEADAQPPRLPIAAKVGGRTGPDGTELQVDFPNALHKSNIDSPQGSNQGCCVFRSLHHASWWQNTPQLRDFPEWLRQKRLPGGGYPGNVKERITAICKERGVPEPPYIQYEGTDLTLLKLACKTGRMPGVTYSFSPTGRYGGGRINHMVNIVHCDDKWVVVLDNNYIGDAAYEWLTPAEFQKTFTGGRQGWAVILLTPPPPPPPRN